MSTVPGSPTDGRLVADGGTRAHVYELTIAAVALLTGLGFVAPDQAQLWINLVAALIPIGALLVARLNVPKPRHARE